MTDNNTSEFNLKYLLKSSLYFITSNFIFVYSKAHLTLVVKTYMVKSFRKSTLRERAYVRYTLALYKLL